jgi:hypothetical protein
MNNNYWMTIHWPPLDEQEEIAKWRYWVFLDERYSSRGRDVKVGDQVFVYETESAPRLIKSGRIIDYQPGSKAIIALVTINRGMEKDRYAKIEKHEGGREFCWRYHFQTSPSSIQGIKIPLKRIRKALKYKPQWAPQIPGGLMRLSEAQFKHLIKEVK